MHTKVKFRNNILEVITYLDINILLSSVVFTMFFKFNIPEPFNYIYGCSNVFSFYDNIVLCFTDLCKCVF